MNVVDVLVEQALHLPFPPSIEVSSKVWLRQQIELKSSLCLHPQVVRCGSCIQEDLKVPIVLTSHDLLLVVFGWVLSRVC